MAHQTSSIKKELEQGLNSMAKIARKQIVSRIMNRQACSKVTTRIHEKCQGRKQRKCSRKRDGMEVEKRLEGKKPIGRFVTLFII